MFTGPKIELPEICKTMSDENLSRVSQRAKIFIDKWSELGEDPEAAFNDLPNLDSEKAVQFYSYVYE